MSKRKNKPPKDYIAANREGSRDSELELTGNGWVAKNKIHPSKKTYNRTTKHKNNSFKDD